jgi:hypothetical protein
MHKINSIQILAYTFARGSIVKHFTTEARRHGGTEKVKIKVFRFTPEA